MPVFDQERVDRLKQILKWHPRGITISDLATKMEMNRNLVAKYLDILLISGQVEMQVIGAAKVYFPSHRVPISSMLEYSTDMLIILDHEQKIIQVNEPVLVQVNKRREALVGRNIKDIDHPLISAIPITVPSKDTEPTHEKISEIECTLEGKKHHYKVKQLQTAFEDGSRGITLIIEDITAHISYQKMLELSEAQYRGIVEDQTEFITRFLPDGTLVFVNEAYARYLGKKKEELLGGPHIPDIDSDSRAVMNERIRSLDIQNPVKSFECRIHHSCGQVRWNLWIVRALLDDNQKPIEYQGVGRDNTEKREAATRINHYVRDMEFLSRKAQEFVELSPDADIFQSIGQGISEIIPDSLITVNSIDVPSGTLTVRAVLPERDQEPLKKYIGKDLQGFQFNISLLSEQHKMHFFSTQQAGKLVYVEENLHTIFFQQIPLDTCDMIKKRLELGDGIYTIGLTRHGILFGNVSFSLRKGETLTNPSIIETFIRHASIVLHRRRTDDALKASEARYRGIVEDQTEFVTRFLPDGTLTYVNDSVCRYFLKDRDELLGQSIFSLSQIPKDEQEKLSLDLHSLNNQNPVRSIEHRVLDPSGRIRWTQWTNRALFDDHGTIFEYQGVGRDITEQKEAEAKIRQYIANIEYLSQTSHEFLELPPDADIYGIICRGVKAILPNAIVVINSIGPKTNVAITRSVLGNEERDVFNTLIGEGIIGMSVKLPEPTELQKERMAVISRRLIKVPGNLFITMHKNVPEAVCAKIEEALNIGDIYSIGLVSQGIILASAVIMLRKGEILEHDDLIEAYIRQASIALLRRNSEETLKESESRYRGIVEDQTEFVTRFLPDGTLTYVNDSVCRYFLMDRAELLERSFFSLIPKEDGERLIQGLHSLNAKNPVLSAELRVLEPQGRIRWTQWTNRALFDDHETLIEIQGVGRDITEQKEAEAKISQYIANIEYLSQKSYEFLELSQYADIYGTICRGVKDILPEAIVLVNSIDLKTDSATTRSVLGDEDRDIFSTLMGEDIIGKTTTLIKGAEGDMAVKAVLSGRIVKIPGNLFFAMHRSVLEAVCAKIEETLNIGDIYIIGLVSQEIILANVVILLRKGDKLGHSDLIEAYIRQASIALLRRNTEDTLQESEKLYRSVIENIQDVFYRSDKDGNLTMASPSWARMLGYDSLDDCIGYNIAEKFYFEPQQRKEFLETVYRNGSVSDYEVVLKRREGSPLYVSTNSHLYYDDAGSLLGVEGIFRDISEQHATAEKIQHHIKQMEFFSQKLQEFIELSPDTDIFEKIATDLKLLIADAMISVNSFNEGTGILTCRSCVGDDDRAVCTRYIGRDPREIDYPIDPEAFQTLRTGQLHKVPFSLYDILFRVVPKETCNQIEEAIKLGDTYGIGFVRGGILFGNATIFLHKGAAIHDIQLIETYARAASIALQRKIAEDSLKESQEIFSSVAKYAPVPIAIIEPDGTYRYVNQKFIEIFGYDLNDFKTGKEWFSLAYPDPEYRKKIIATWKSDLEASRSGQQRPETFTVRCKNGVDREILFRPVTLSDNKQCVVYEDLTDQHKVEQVQKFLSLIAETTSDAIIGEKTDGAIISGNHANEHLYDRDTTKTPGLLSPHYLSNALKMARDYIAILDRSGKCVWVNDALVSAVNAGSCNDLAGKSIALYIAPEFRKMALDSLMEVKKSGNKTVPLMMLSSSGRVPVEANISAITTEEGDLFGYMAIARNVERETIEKSR